MKFFRMNDRRPLRPHEILALMLTHLTVMMIDGSNFSADDEDDPSYCVSSESDLSDDETTAVNDDSNCCSSFSNV